MTPFRNRPLLVLLACAGAIALGVAVDSLLPDRSRTSAPDLTHGPGALDPMAGNTSDVGEGAVGGAGRRRTRQQPVPSRIRRSASIDGETTLEARGSDATGSGSSSESRSTSGAGGRRGDARGWVSRSGGGKSGAGVRQNREAGGDARDPRLALEEKSGDAPEADPESEEAQTEEEVPTGSVRGIVVTGAGEPAANVRVQYLGPAVTGAEQPEAVTDACGEFLLSGLPLPPVVIRLMARQDALASQPMSCQARPDPAPTEPWVRLVLQGAGTITVGVLDSAAHPISDARVFVKNASEQQVHATGVSDADGLVLFENIPAGDVVVLAQKIGYNPPGYGADAVSRRALSLRTGESVDLTLTLVPTVDLAGLVVDSRGQAVAGADVYLKVLSASGLKSTAYGSPVARTDAGGRFTLTQLPDGRAELCALAVGRGVSPWTAVADPGDDGLREAFIQFWPAYTLSGTVVNSRGVPLPDAVVTWRLSDPAYAHLQAWTAPPLGDDGGFVFYGVPPLPCVVEATRPPTGSAARELTAADVTSGKPLRLNVTAPDELSVFGSVTNSQGNGVAGATVRVHGVGGGIAAAGATDALGRFTLPLQGVGPWTISAATAGLAPWYANVDKQSLANPVLLTLFVGANFIMDVTTDLSADLIPPGTEVTVRLTLIAIPASPFVVTQKAVLQATTAFCMDSLCPGRYLCEISAPGMALQSFAVNIQNLPGVDQFLPYSIVLKLGAAVLGKVITEEGTAMGDAAVSVVGLGQLRGTTAADGTFRLTGVPAGAVVVRAETADRYGLSSAAAVTAGGQVGVGNIVLDQVRTDAPSQVVRKISIGIVWSNDGESWSVGSAAAGSSAAAAQLQAGDRLLAVDGVDATGWSMEQLQNGTVGEAGTSVDLRLDRAGRQFSVRLERQIVSP